MRIINKALLSQAAIALAFCCLSLQARAEVAFPYLSNPEARKAADNLATELLVTPPSPEATIGQVGPEIDTSKPAQNLVKFSALLDNRLAKLDRAALAGQPTAMLLKCYMGTDAKGPRWVVSEGIAWCTILANEAPAAMGDVSGAARRALDSIEKSKPNPFTELDPQLMALLHQRLAHPEQQGPIQSVDPVVVVKPGVPVEKFVGYTLFNLGGDFTDYINRDDLARAFFNQQFVNAPQGIVKLGEYARFATANAFVKTLGRHPELTRQVQTTP